MISTGFNGRVQFDCTPPNMKTIVVREGMFRDVPEARDFTVSSDTGILFSNLNQFLGRTRSIELLDGEPDANAEDLAAFWAFASTCQDYRAIWDRFLMMDAVINNEWNNALSAAEDARLKASPIIRPGAPSDEDLEGQGEDGKKKSKSGKPSSRRSTMKQKPSSTVVSQAEHSN